MSCEQALELMSARLDGALTPEQQAELNAHLETCPDCRRLMEAMEGLDQKLSGLREPAPEGLKRGVLYRIDQASGKAKKPARRWFGPGTAIGAVAAVLVLLVGLGVFPGLNARENAAPATKDMDDASMWVKPSPAATAEFADSETAPQETMRHIIPIPAQNAGATDEKNGISDVSAEEPAYSEEILIPDDYYHSGGNGDLETAPTPVSDTLRAECAALSEEEQAMVLLYTEFAPESLFALLEREEPDLGALTEKLEPERSGDLLYCSTDCGTALAIQEWLLSNLPQSELMDSEVRAAEMKLMSRMEELDPGSGSLYRVITWAPPDHPIQWPAEWPADWAVRLRTEENWGLFFPDENFAPNEAKPAYLVFLPVAP